MSYGDTSKGWHGDWVLSEDESRSFIREAVEAGINFFDTANMYSRGASEEVIGRLLPEFARRDEIGILEGAEHGKPPSKAGLYHIVDGFSRADAVLDQAQHIDEATAHQRRVRAVRET